jgi:hypothetical protein
MSKKFGGETFDPALDEERLSTQLSRVFALMKDGRWRTLAGIVEQCRPATEASVSARLRDFRKKKFGSHVVEHRRDETADGLWWYRLIPNENPKTHEDISDHDEPRLLL